MESKRASKVVDGMSPAVQRCAQRAVQKSVANKAGTVGCLIALPLLFRVGPVRDRRVHNMTVGKRVCLEVVLAANP